MKQKTFHLIKGEFSAVDAKQILLELLSNKIKFHQGDQWSREERNTSITFSSQQRIQELVCLKEELKLFFDEAQGKEVELVGEIVIKVK